VTRVVTAQLVAALLLTTAPRALAQDSPASNPSDPERPRGAQRFRNFMVDAAGPVVLVETIAWAGAAQAKETPVEWGDGANAFGKRYASLIGQGIIQESVTYGMSEALAVDSRFHKSDRRGFFPRAGDALAQAVTSRRVNGTRIVSAPLLAGYAVGGVGMMAWYPNGSTYKDGLGYGGLALASRAGVNRIREFIMRR